MNLLIAEKIVGELRIHLHTLIDESDSLVKDEVVQASQNLDLALNLYAKLKLDNELKKTG